MVSSARDIIHIPSRSITHCLCVQVGLTDRYEKENVREALLCSSEYVLDSSPETGGEKGDPAKRRKRRKKKKAGQTAKRHKAGSSPPTLTEFGRDLDSDRREDSTDS